MEHHAHDVDAQITVVIKVSCYYAADAAEQCHSGGRHLELREKLGQPQPYRPVKIKIENTLYLACFIGSCEARMRGLCRLRRQFACRKGSSALLLQYRRNERVGENVQGLVQVRARMLGGHARAKTDSSWRHSRIIHRRDPETAAAKFMPKPIHALSITNDDGHYVGCRSSGIESKASKLRVEVIGVFPKLHPQFRLTGAEFQCFQNGRNHHRRQRTGVNIRMRIETQILQCLLRTRDKASQRSERFGECSINERDAIFDAKLLSRTTAMVAACQHGVRFVNENTCAMRLRDSK